MKALIVINHMDEGGAQRSLINMLNLMDEKQFDVDLFLMNKKGMFLSQVPQWVNILDVPDEVSYCYRNADIKALKSFRSLKAAFFRGLWTVYFRLKAKGNKDLSRQLRWNKYKKILPKIDTRYDVAIAYMHGEPMYYIIDNVKADRKIGWVHNDYTSTGYSAKLDLSYYSKFDELVTISDECLSILKREFASIQDRFTYLPNIVSEKAIRKSADEFKPAEYDYNNPIILSVGRLNEQKGFDIAIDAAALLKKRGVPFNWYIIGTGALEKELKLMAEKLGVSENIIFLGQRKNPYPYMKYSWIVAQPSRYEGKSIVLDEAKIIGRPVIATNYNTVYDQLKPEEGMIVNMTGEAVAEGLEKLIKDKELRENYTSNLLNCRYGNEEVMEKYISLISGEI